MTFVLLASLAHGLFRAHVDVSFPPSTPSIAAASSPVQDPCGHHDGAGHDHALCGHSASCPICAPVDAGADFVRGQQPKMAAGFDLLHSGSDPQPPFHPPKLLIIG